MNDIKKELKDIVYKDPDVLGGMTLNGLLKYL